jgi:hypothetical protein
MSGPIRSALMTAKSIGGKLELGRAKEAKKRAPGQVSPSKYMPGVPRQVRAEGGPLRLYHGTEHSHPIDELDPFISPDQLGVHLGDAPTANRFATRMTYDPNSGFTRSPRVIPFNAKIQNPLRLHDKHGTWDPSIVYKQLVEKGLEKHNPQIEERLANLENGDGPTGDSVMDHGKALKYQKQAVQEVHDMIRKHGYDGVVYLNRHEMPTDEAKARMEDVKRPGYIMRGQLNKMTDDQFRKHFPEATDSYIAFDPEQLESPFGKGTGVGYAGGGDVKSGLNQSVLTKKHLAKAEGGTVDEQKNEAPAARLGDVAQAGGFPLSGGIRGGEGVLPASLPAHGEVDLTGLPTNIKIPKLGMSIVAAHNPVIRQAARDYARAVGIDYNPPTSYQRVDPERATRIAHAYENMEHDPSHPLVKASYEALKQETLAQYRAAKAAGLKAEFYPDPTKDPYRSQPRLMSEDVNKNNHMYVYPTDAGFGTGQQPEEHENNPLLGDSGERWNGKPVTFNDLFRAVHDYYGHVKEGVGFRGDGEENAWRSHAAMYSPLARIAMGSETRGQNSLLNYGPNGERNRNASTDDTFFSPQKLGVLPVWAHHEGAEFIRPEERAQMEEIYKNFGVDPEGVVGASIRNSMSVFPKPQRMFPEDARPPGGQYLAMPDKRDVTGHKAAAATIGVQPGGKPFFKASADAVEQTGSTGRGTAMARANLFKQKAGWKWLNAPEEHGSTDTIVSVEHRGKHHYALNAHFPRGVDLARYENSPTEPRLRPTTTGNVQLGPQAGSILVRGKEHPVYRHVIVKETGGLVAPQYENPVKLAKKALMAAKKTGSRS